MHGTEQEYILGMAGDKKPEPLKIKQYDKNSRKARISLTAFGKEWNIPAGALVYINTKKNDGTMAMDDCEIVDDNIVIAPISQCIALVEGEHEAELYILMPDGDIRSQTFTIRTYPAVMDQKTIESSNEFGALQNALLDVQTATNAAQEAASEALIQADEARDAAAIAIDAAASIDEAVQAAARAKTSETNAKASEAAAAQTKADVEALKEGFIGYDKIESGRKYANALTMTVEGEGQVAVTDAWDAPVVDMEIDGASEQVTTTGAQLLDLPDKSGSANGLSYTFKNGVAIVSGTPSAQYAGVYRAPLSLAPGNYYVSGGEYTAGSLCTQVNIAENDDSVKCYANKTFAVTGAEKSIDIVLQTGAYITPVSCTLRPMLNTGTTAIPWEPYTGGQPSPSPNYPQAIKGVEHVVNSGAQLFDASRIPTKTAGGATVTNNGDGSFTITGSGTATAVFNDMVYYSAEEAAKLFVRPGKYTLSGGISTPYIALTMAENDVLLIDVALPIKDSVSFTVTEDMIEKIKSGAIKVKSGFFSQPDRQLFPGTVKPMLNYGDALPWEPYNGQQRETDLQVDITGKNLFATNKIPTKTASGATVTNNGDGSFRISGNGTTSSFYDNALSLSVPEALKLFDKPGTYTLSGGVSVPYVILTVTKLGATIVHSDLSVSPDKSFSITQETVDMIKGGEATVKIGFYSLSGRTIIPGLVRPMLNYDSSAQTWEPYREPQSVNLPLSEPLHGIGDVRDRIAYKDGVWGIERRFGTQVFDGSADEAWVAVLNNDGLNCRNGSNFVQSKAKSNGAAICTTLIKNNGVTSSRPGFKIAGNASVLVYSNDFNTSDVSLWTAYLTEHPMTVIYELATPLWEPFPAETQTALNALTTHPGTTYLTVTSTDVAAPVRLTYVQDTHKVIDGLRLDLAEQMTELQAQIDQLKVTNNLS